MIQTRCILSLVIFVCLMISATLADDVLQHHRNATRDGLYVDPLFTQAAVTTTHRDLSFRATLPGPIYAQPLFVNNGPGGRAVVIVATEQNDVWALDAVDGTPAWTRNFGTPVPLSEFRPCGNIDPLGITGTPVIDVNARTIYVDAMTTPDGGATKQHLIYALSLDDGSTIAGWPVDVNTVTSGGVMFDSAVQNQRGALILNGEYLYVPYGGHFRAFACDGIHYGWVVAVPVSDPSNPRAWKADARGGGVWSPGGLSTDGQSIFAATGTTSGAVKWMGGEAVIRLGPGATFSGEPADYFAPSNWQSLDQSFSDIGGEGPIVFDAPGATPSQLLVALGKNGVAYLLDRNYLGGIGTGDGVIGEGLQSRRVTTGLFKNAAAAYTVASGTYVVATTATGFGVACPGTAGNLIALKIGASAPPTIDVAWCAVVPGQGSPIVTTTDGTSEPVVWSISTEPAETTSRLYAFNAETGEVLFSGGGPDEEMSMVRRFQTPIVVNGRIFVAADNELYAFSVEPPASGSGMRTVKRNSGH
jgi:outer membrane protein assembly factor BamB